MSRRVEPLWRDALSAWTESVPSVSRVWISGSRVRGNARPSSDLDVALLLEPVERDATTERIVNGKTWRKDAQSHLGPSPRLDLQPACPLDDKIVWPAVQHHGVLIYERAT